MSEEISTSILIFVLCSVPFYAFPLILGLSKLAMGVAKKRGDEEEDDGDE